MWAPLAAVLITYAVTFLIHPILFGLIYLMMSVYFHKAQVTMLRGYALYLEYTFWFVFAECSTRRAQETLRRFDQNVVSSFHMCLNLWSMRRRKNV